MHSAAPTKARLQPRWKAPWVETPAAGMAKESTGTTFLEQSKSSEAAGTPPDETFLKSAASRAAQVWPQQRQPKPFKAKLAFSLLFYFLLLSFTFFSFLFCFRSLSRHCSSTKYYRAFLLNSLEDPVTVSSLNSMQHPAVTTVTMQYVAVAILLESGFPSTDFFTCQMQD